MPKNPYSKKLVNSPKNTANNHKLIKSKPVPKPFKTKKYNYKSRAENPSKALFPMSLNKFLAKAGVSDRRGAVELIKAGYVRVNQQIITNPAHRIYQSEQVSYKGKLLKYQEQHIYILLNKPKDCISTTKDTRGRKTVLDIIGQTFKQKVYPVGRLDRNTTGLLLLTNDGELCQKLSHPKFQIRKIYELSLDKSLTAQDYASCLNGVLLEDGLASFDALEYLDASGKNLGVELHSGRNRVIRRMFEHLGYKVKSLDRVLFAELTKKNLPRGKYRTLSQIEISRLYSKK